MYKKIDLSTLCRNEMKAPSVHNSWCFETRKSFPSKFVFVLSTLL